MLEEILTPQEVSKVLKISERTAKTLLRKGEIPGFKVGRFWRVRKSDLDFFMTPLDFKPLNEDELDESDREALQRAREDIKEGRVFSWEEIQKEYDL